MDQEGILSIIGPRRSGKSVLLLNVIDHLLKQGIQKERILFFSGDDPALFNGKINLGDIFEKYANDVLHENLNDLSKKIFILILLKS
ncbi:AAA family ATPase [bacterium]|nr:AAA family ATPase [bacterium]